MSFRAHRVLGKRRRESVKVRGGRGEGEEGRSNGEQEEW